MGKQLPEFKVRIAAGLTDLRDGRVRAYREHWAREGFDLPPWTPMGAPPIYDQPILEKPGTLLKQEFKWIATAMGKAKCGSCASLAKKMDRKGCDWCENNADEIVKAVLANAGMVRKLFPKGLGEDYVRQKLTQAIEQARAKAAKARAELEAKRPRHPVTLPFTYIENVDRRWAACMTIAPRPDPVWEDTLEAAQTAGFRVHLFAEPGVQGLTFEEDVTIHKEKLGAHRNYMYALKKTLSENPDATHILYLQDDGFIAAGAKDFLNSIKWPNDAGLISLWCPSGMAYDGHEPGLRRTPRRNIVGAVGYAMTRQTAELLISDDLMLNWRGSRDDQTGADIKALDIATGECLSRNKIGYYYTTFSVVDHYENQPNNSSLGHGSNEGFRKSYNFIGGSAFDIWEHATTNPVHVVIPVHNSWDVTDKCLDALRESNAPVYVHVIANGCDKETMDRLNADGGIRIDMLSNYELNMGFTKAIQHGINEAKGRHVLLLNNDCYVEPDTIPELLAEMTNDTAAVSPIVSKAAWCNPQENKRGVITRKECLSFACCLLNSEAIKDIGSLPTDAALASGLGIDDWWCRTARRRRWLLKVTGHTYVYHDHMTTFKRTGQNRAALQEKAKEWLKEHFG